MPKTKKPNHPKWIQTREFPVLWNVSTRTFDPTGSGRETHAFGKTSAAVQAGGLAWHMRIVGVDHDNVQHGFEVQNEANQTLCFILCLNHPENHGF